MLFNYSMFFCGGSDIFEEAQEKLQIELKNAENRFKKPWFVQSDRPTRKQPKP